LPPASIISRDWADAKASDGGSITEGIGLGRVTAIIETLKVDKPYLIPDEEAVPIIFDLIEHEGLCMGGSTGINVAGAIRLARDLGPGHTIVTVLADHGSRYLSKLFNPQFLREKGLPVPAWLERRSTRKVLIDPLNPSSLNVALADRIAGIVARDGICDELRLHPIVLQCVIQLVRLGRRYAEIPGIRHHQRGGVNLRCECDRRVRTVRLEARRCPR
jgi:hypothetical protein